MSFFEFGYSFLSNCCWCISALCIVRHYIVTTPSLKFHMFEMSDLFRPQSFFNWFADSDESIHHNIHSRGYSAHLKRYCAPKHILPYVSFPKCLPTNYLFPNAMTLYFHIWIKRVYFKKQVRAEPLHLWPIWQRIIGSINHNPTHITPCKAVDQISRSFL